MSSVYKRGKKYWRKAYKDGKPVYTSLNTSDKSEASYLCAKMDQESVERVTPFSKIRCQIALDQYKDTISQRCTREYCNASIRRIKAILGDSIMLTHINEPQIISTISESKSEYDHNNSVSAIKAFFKWCVKSGYLQRSPAENVKKIIIQESPRESFSPDDVKRILLAAKKEEIYPAVITALYTGMRRSELFGLTWDDVDMTQKVFVLSKTKNRRVRLIPIQADVFSILKSIQKEDGKVFNMANERRVLRRIFKKAGVVGNWHHFRHTFCTHLLRSGVDLKTVCSLAGHSSISVTSKYLSTTPSHMAEAVKRLQFSYNKKAA